MPLLDITDDNFRTIYQENDIVVLDFWAIWCGPCQQFAPVFEVTSKKYEDIVFGKVETESNIKISQYFHVRSIPTIIIIREGLELFRHTGVIGEHDFINIIQQIKDANMDEVKAAIDEEEKNL